MLVSCPVCGSGVLEAAINEHLDQACAGAIVVSTHPTATGGGNSITTNSNSITTSSNSITTPKQTRLSFGASPAPTKRLKLANQPHEASPQRTSPHASLLMSPPSKPSSPHEGLPAPLASRPLAELARPESLDEFLGHDKIVGQASLLRQLIASKRIQSMILWGPPGCGKTTLARIIAKELGTQFREMSATIHNVADVRKAADEAKNYRKLTGRKAVVFLDEIHRFTKAQQDFFLPPVERGDFVFLAATTENPSFRVNAALLSRCRVFVLDKHEQGSLRAILRRAASIKLHGRSHLNPSESPTDLANSSIPKNDPSQPSLDIPDDVIDFLANMCDGDARTSINGLEMAMDSAISAGNTEISKSLVQEALQKTHLLYDREGEEHYNIISALHKSMRGSDANASLYWLGRMIYAGEDPLYVARRLVRFASEDIGLADNSALPLAISTYQACQMIGMPECDVILAHCVTYLAKSPKCVQVYHAIKKVKQTIQETEAYPVPLHIRNAPTKLMKDIGYGDGYKYNPDYDEPVEQDYLPAELKIKEFL